MNIKNILKIKENLKKEGFEIGFSTKSDYEKMTGFLERHLALTRILGGRRHIDTIIRLQTLEYNITKLLIKQYKN